LRCFGERYAEIEILARGAAFIYERFPVVVRGFRVVQRAANEATDRGSKAQAFSHDFYISVV
jgi:hypothetical protein